MVDVSTLIQRPSLQSAVGRFHDLRQSLHAFGQRRHLLQPEQLAMRLKVLDKLDAIIGDVDAPIACSDPGLIACARALRSQFEAANNMLYDAAHAEIALRGDSSALDRLLRDIASVVGDEKHQLGLSFDLFDEIVCDVLQLRGPIEAGLLPSAEMTAYQPTPARHILDLITRCRLSSDDILVDLGSGLGHVPLLVSIRTGIRTLGIEIQPDHAASAQRAARRLNLTRVRFMAEDARTTDLSSGTVFYMFTPFTGSILTEVLHRLHKQSKARPIRICTLGPCAHVLQDQTWLRTNQLTDAERITIFSSRWAPGLEASNPKRIGQRNTLLRVNG